MVLKDGYLRFSAVEPGHPGSLFFTSDENQVVLCSVISSEWFSFEYQLDFMGKMRKIKQEYDSRKMAQKHPFESS